MKVWLLLVIVIVVMMLMGASWLSIIAVSAVVAVGSKYMFSKGKRPLTFAQSDQISAREQQAEAMARAEAEDNGM